MLNIFTRTVHSLSTHNIDIESLPYSHLTNIVTCLATQGISNDELNDIQIQLTPAQPPICTHIHISVWQSNKSQFIK